MSRAPFAQWRPIPVNYSPGGMVAYDGVILHVMEGTLDGSDSWFRNPQAQASAHFGVGRDGRVYQWVDTADKAWAQAEGNPRNISIENEGNAGEPLTAAQVEQVAEILAWAHTGHGVPLRINDDPASQGLGWHGMGGAPWGGHTGCPGDQIKAQRLAILTRAGAILNPQPQPPPVPQLQGGENVHVDAKIQASNIRPDGTGWIDVPVPGNYSVISAVMNGSDAMDQGGPLPDVKLIARPGPVAGCWRVNFQVPGPMDIRLGLG